MGLSDAALAGLFLSAFVSATVLPGNSYGLGRLVPQGKGPWGRALDWVRRGRRVGVTRRSIAALR